MRVLIIGYGSIGKRHEEVLLNFDTISRVEIVTKQSLSNKTTYTTLQNVQNLEMYDYFIIASETDRHYEQLKFLETNVKDKLIFCEKPLFETSKDLIIKNNKVYVGYVLRFHPLLQKLDHFLEKEIVLSISVSCGQYLPTWRIGTDYRDSYSAKKEHGGGVLLDLSHEIDYLQHLCGRIDELKSYQVQISDLEISSDDLVTFIGKTDKGTIVNLSIDYISKITHRRLLLNTIEYTYELDFINNRLIKKDKSLLEETFVSGDLERNSMFEAMHHSILTTKKSVCTYKEAEEVMKTINMVQEQN